MTELAAFLRKLSPNSLGEALREITFVGEGKGCYENFDMRPDVISWRREQTKDFYEEYFDSADDKDMAYIVNKAHGYTFVEGGVTVDVFWYWNGDGTLCFRTKEREEIIAVIVNTDCKKSYQWENLL
jgi:hypothetical protein